MADGFDRHEILKELDFLAIIYLKPAQSNHGNLKHGRRNHFQFFTEFKKNIH